MLPNAWMAVLADDWPLVVLAIAVVLGAIVSIASQWATRGGRARRVLAVLFCGLAVPILLVLQYVAPEDRWLWTLACIPPAFVVLHGINVAILRNPYFFEETVAPEYAAMAEDMRSIAKAAHAQEKRFYGTAPLTIRFAMPAAILTLIDLVVGHSLLLMPMWDEHGLDDAFVEGFRVGALGAYVAVVLFLGGRAMRGDVTPGGAVWAAVTMVVGPLFAGSLQILFVGEPADRWSDLLLPFAAGFSLRFIVDFVDAAVRRAFGAQADSGSRLVPLMRLRGITREIEDRLLEEGITDVAMMATANPQRLRRNTRFDKRQILSWIDEALLVTYLPTSWQALESDGVTGAIGLVWYSGDASFGATSHADRLEKLAQRNKIEPESLRDAVQRMADDAQVKLVWALYRIEDPQGGEDPPLHPK